MRVARAAMTRPTFWAVDKVVRFEMGLLALLVESGVDVDDAMGLVWCGYPAMLVFTGMVEDEIAFAVTWG